MRYLWAGYFAATMAASWLIGPSHVLGADPNAQYAQRKPVTGPREPAEIIRMLDRNGDGKVDRSEFRINIISVFGELDTDGDGGLTPNELPGISAEAFAKADNRNNNGKLDVNEFADSEFAKFENLDLNRDGFITADEIATFRQRMQTK